MIHYILQTIAFQVFFLLVYDIVLKKETFFNWNRVYLLITVVVSFILPFIKIDRFKAIVPQNYIITLPEVVLGKLNTINNSPTSINASTTETIATLFTFQSLFYLGVFIASIIFLFKLINVLALIYTNPKTKVGKIRLVHVIKSSSAFSFFNYIFLGKQINDEEKEVILKHEMVHVNQKHTIDLLFFEVLRILFWFNPLVYIYQSKMVTLHEFIADADAVKHQNKNDYYQNLLSRVFNTKHISFINPFYKQSLIKKRIVMLQKAKSKQINLLKYALLIPMVLGMLIYTSCEKESSVTSIETISVEEQIQKLKFAIEKQGSLTQEQKQQILEISKLNNEKMFVEISELNNDYSEALDIPFSVIDQVPVFPGCEGLSKEEQKKCMSKNISKLVGENFNTKLANEFGLTGRQRINVIFKIDTEGNITDVRFRAPHPSLEDEAIRVIKTLPKMIPGEQNGKKVNVPYSLPIIFQVGE